MLKTLAAAHYRSLLDFTAPLGQLNLITGNNGSGKSNFYRALRVLAETAQGGVVRALAHEGGLHSALWAGPEHLSRAMKQGDVPVQGTPRQHAVRLRLGFGTDDFGYSIAFGLPKTSSPAFMLDPEIKHEVIWGGPFYRPASALVERQGPMVRSRQGRSWQVVAQHLLGSDSLFSELADPSALPEVYQFREQIRQWRFYDYFRTDPQAAARQPQIGTFTPVLHHDGHDLAAALQTILEIGEAAVLKRAIDDAFPGCAVRIQRQDNGWFQLQFSQPGLLRPLSSGELSDGTLRYLLLVAALLSPRPPPLLVLNEPENSLHPDLLPALARLIRHAAQHTQVWVISHANRLINALNQDEACQHLVLEKVLGETVVCGQERLDRPPWNWPKS